MGKRSYNYYQFLTALMVCVKVYGYHDLDWKIVFLPILYDVVSVVSRLVGTAVGHIVASIMRFFDDNDLKRSRAPDGSRITWDPVTKAIYDSSGNIIEADCIEE